MKEIWLQDLGWDDKPSTEMSQRQSFLDEIREPEVTVEHHGFSDSSGAAIYIRVEMGQMICLQQKHEWLR